MRLTQPRPCIDVVIHNMEFATPSDLVEFFYDAVASMTELGMSFVTTFARLTSPTELAEYAAVKKIQETPFIEATVIIGGERSLFFASIYNLREFAEKHTANLFSKRTPSLGGIYRKTSTGKLYQVLTIETETNGDVFVTYAPYAPYEDANSSDPNQSYRRSTVFHSETQQEDGTWLPTFSYVRQGE